jgi:hypothetical protein
MLNLVPSLRMILTTQELKEIQSLRMILTTQTLNLVPSLRLSLTAQKALSLPRAQTTSRKEKPHPKLPRATTTDSSQVSGQAQLLIIQRVPTLVSVTSPVINMIE